MTGDFEVERPGGLCTWLPSGLPTARGAVAW